MPVTYRGPRCQEINRSKGTICGRACGENLKCYLHDPDRAEERARNGGKRFRRFDAVGAAVAAETGLKPKTLEPKIATLLNAQLDIERELAEIKANLVANRITTQVANSLSNVCRARLLALNNTRIGLVAERDRVDQLREAGEEAAEAERQRAREAAGSDAASPAPDATIANLLTQ